MYNNNNSLRSLVSFQQINWYMYLHTVKNVRVNTCKYATQYGCIWTLFKICACNWHLFMNGQGGTGGVYRLEAVGLTLPQCSGWWQRPAVSERTSSLPNAPQVSQLLQGRHSEPSPQLSNDKIHVHVVKFLNSDRQL